MDIFCEIIPYFLLKITLQEYELHPDPYKLRFQWKTKYHRNKPEQYFAPEEQNSKSSQPDWNRELFPCQ